MPPKFADVSSLGVLAKHANGRWRVRAKVDGRDIYGPFRETEAEVADDLAKARRSSTRPAYIVTLQRLFTGSAIIRESAPVRRRPAQSGAASGSVPQPASSVRSRSRSRRETAAQQENASVRKPPAQSGTQSSNDLQPAAFAEGRGRSGGMWRRSLSGASSRRGGSHPAQSRKRPRVSSPGAGEEDGGAASSVDAEILTPVRALGRYPIEHRDPKSEEERR